MGAGIVTLTAEHDRLSARASLPCGFVVTAWVHENAPTRDVVLPGAQVVVVGGPHAGSILSTDAQGRVAIPPVASPGFRLQFKKPGYDDADYVVEQLPRETALDIEMMPVPGVRIDYVRRCPYLVDSISTHREGRVRLSASVPAGPGYTAASVMVYTPRKIWAEAFADRTRPTALVDALLPAGDYLVYGQGLCTADSKASVEHQR